MLFFVRLLKAGRRRHVAILLSALVAVVVAGAGAFSLTQHLPFTTSLYWAITTATTVGYGDVLPHSASGRFVASVVMLTAIPLLGATFAVVTGAAAAAGIRRILQMGNEFPSGTYRLVVGMHPTVPAIIEELVKADDAVVLVADVDPVSVREDVHVIRGDPTSQATLRKARPAGAQHALVAAANDGDVLIMAVLLREQAPDLPISALSNSGPVSEALRAIGVNQTVSVDELVAHTLAKSLESPHAGDLLLRLVDSEQHRLVEVEVGSSSVGKQLSAERQDRDGLVLGLVHDGAVDLGIGTDPTLVTGDRLLVAVPSGPGTGSP
jgi:voltage-gated potassium channel